MNSAVNAMDTHMLKLNTALALVLPVIHVARVYHTDDRNCPAYVPQSTMLCAMVCLAIEDAIAAPARTYGTKMPMLSPRKASPIITVA